MKTVELNVATRGAMTKNELSRFRAEGQVPAVLYGKHIETNFPITVEGRAFNKILNSIGRTVLLQFKSEEKELNGKAALIKEVQKKPTSEDLVHIDLIEVKEDEPIQVSIKLNLTGTPTGVKNKGGVLDVQRRAINIECLPKDTPDSITVDLTGLDLDHVLHIGDLETPNGVTIKDNAKLTIAAVHLPKSAKNSTDEEAEEAEGEEAAED